MAQNKNTNAKATELQGARMSTKFETSCLAGKCAITIVGSTSLSGVWQKNSKSLKIELNTRLDKLDAYFKKEVGKLVGKNKQEKKIDWSPKSYWIRACRKPSRNYLRRLTRSMNLWQRLC